MGRIHTLHIENFKSYGGTHTLGPFFHFTCIIGPNGAGKSNIMDAISFVLGVRSMQLRSSNLSELIHRKGTIQTAKHAQVELVYDYDSGEQLTFRRRVDEKGHSTYFLDGRAVTFSTYNQQLESIGILIKAKNFLVFQGDVAEVAQKTPEQFTEVSSVVDTTTSCLPSIVH